MKKKMKRYYIPKLDNFYTIEELFRLGLYREEVYKLVRIGFNEETDPQDWLKMEKE